MVFVYLGLALCVLFALYLVGNEYNRRRRYQRIVNERLDRYCKPKRVILTPAFNKAVPMQPELLKRRA